jgi:membrane associated rhomboid family serine protease
MERFSCHGEIKVNGRFRLRSTPAAAMSFGSTSRRIAFSTSTDARATARDAVQFSLDGVFLFAYPLRATAGGSPPSGRNRSDRREEAAMERDQAATSPETDVDSTELRSREPAFNLPPGLTGILSFLIAVHVLRTYVLPAEIDQELILNFAFLPVRYTLPLGEQGLVWLWTPVTYSFLHGSWEHLIFNVFWMVAFGAPVVRRIGMARLALFWCLSAAAAVGLHIIFHWGEMAVVIGASGVVSGLMGAAARFVFSPSGRISRQFAHLNRRLSFAETLTNRSVLVFTGIWFLTNLLVGFGFLSIGGAGSVAWEAHIGGFLFGFLLFAFFDPRR